MLALDPHIIAGAFLLALGFALGLLYAAARLPRPGCAVPHTGSSIAGDIGMDAGEYERIMRRLRTGGAL